MFLRLLFYFLFLAVFGTLFWGIGVWLGDPVSFQVKGYQIDTKLGYVVIASILAVFAILLVYRWIRALILTPKRISESLGKRSARKGYQALTQGMVALAAGDPVEARKKAKIANRHLKSPPLVSLIEAQAAQMDGNEEAATSHYQAMLSEPETSFLGTRGLLMQALKVGDREEALTLAREAYGMRPKTRWVLESLYELEATEGQLEKAESAVRQSLHQKFITKDVSNKRSALLKAEGARVLLESKNYEYAVEKASRGLGYAPESFALKLFLIEGLLSQEKWRKASSQIKKAWAQRPEQELLALYERARTKDGAKERNSFKLMKELASENPTHALSFYALAKGAVKLEKWQEARDALQSSLGAGALAITYRLLADIEETAPDGSAAKARDYLKAAAHSRSASLWFCDFCETPQKSWSLSCGSCGHFNTVEWREPYTQPFARFVAPDQGSIQVLEEVKPLEAEDAKDLK